MYFMKFSTIDGDVEKDKQHWESMAWNLECLTVIASSRVKRQRIRIEQLDPNVTLLLILAKLLPQYTVLMKKKKDNLE